MHTLNKVPFSHTQIYIYIYVCVYMYIIYIVTGFTDVSLTFMLVFQVVFPLLSVQLFFFQTMIGTRAPADDETTQISILGCLTNTLTSRDHVPIEYN